METLRPGVRLGDRYRLESRIGAGGMGEVWRAVDDVLGRVVAVKAMLPTVAGDPGFARRFLAEATAMARVNHPAVASIHDYGRGGDVTYLVMEFVDGESLAQILARGGRLAPTETMRLIARAAEGLQAVHDCGIVHRDIKPANLMIRRDGSVLLTDFGIARREDASRLTASGAILGTPSYLSPEQVLGHQATFLSDVYALGLTAYECLAGQRPFEGDNPYAVALQRLRAAPKTIGVTLPVPVLGVVERALATDPAHRWPSAGAMAAAAHAASDGIAPPPPFAPPLAPPSAPSLSPSPAPPLSPSSALPLSTSSAPPLSSSSVPPLSSSSAPPLSPSPAPPLPQPLSPPLSPPRRVRRAVVAAVAAVLLIGGGAAVWGLTRTGPGKPSAAASRPAGPSAAASAPAGFTPCGTGYCPSTPMCWAGLTEISGKAYSPQAVDCDQTHYWQTFAALEMPADAAGTRPDDLLNRSDVAAVCSAPVMTSRGRKTTGSWIRAAWPIDLPGTGRTLLHCLAQPPSHESTGSAF